MAVRVYVLSRKTRFSHPSFMEQELNLEKEVRVRKFVGKILVGSLFALILVAAVAPVQAQLPASPRRFVDFLDVRCYQITNQPALNLGLRLDPLNPVSTGRGCPSGRSPRG